MDTNKNSSIETETHNTDAILTNTQSTFQKSKLDGEQTPKSRNAIGEEDVIILSIERLLR